MKKYEKGSVIEFQNTALGELLIIDECLEEDLQYLLVVPYKPTDENVDIEMDKLVLLKVKEDGNAFVVTDKQIVQKIVDKLLKL